MLDIIYAKNFLKEYKKIKNTNTGLSEEIKEKVQELRKTENHKRLKVHKLKKPFIKKYAFSVNYKTRIIFEYTDKKTIVALLSVGDHDIYS